MPIKIETDVGFAILINEVPICVFGWHEILYSRPIDIDQHSFKNMKNPVDRFNAVNKAYADRIKYKTATGNIPNTVMTDHTLFTFPAAKAFTSGKIKICEIWLNGWQMSGLQHQVQLFATSWPGFHKFSRGPSLMIFFTSSPPVNGFAIFVSTI